MESARLLDEDFIDPSWKVADSLVSSLGILPSLYTAAIRAIRCSRQILRTEEMSRVTRFSRDVVAFPLKVSPTLRGALYFLADETNKVGLDTLPEVSLRNLLGIFGPNDLSAALSLTTVHRMLRKRCDPREWDNLESRISTHLLVGSIVGSKIERIGSGNGMFMAGLRCLSLGFLLMSSPERFKNYRLFLERKGVLFDVQGEHERWGCDHLQIASSLSSALGYGVIPRVAFGLLSAQLRADTRAVLRHSTSGEPDIWRATIYLVEQLLLGAGAGGSKVAASPQWALPDVAKSLEREVHKVVISCARVIRGALSIYGNCTVVHAGVEALHEFAEALEADAPFDLVCLDLGLPDIDGIEVLKELRATEAGYLSGQTKVLVITANTDPKTVVEIFQQGGTAFFSKPVDIAELRKEVECLLGASGAELF